MVNGMQLINTESETHNSDKSDQTSEDEVEGTYSRTVMRVIDKDHTRHASFFSPEGVGSGPPKLLGK